MSERVGLEWQDGVALLSLQEAGTRGMGLGLDAELRRALDGHLNTIQEAKGLRGLILLAAEAGWPVSDDPADDYDTTAPTLRALCARISKLKAPVVAVLSGVVSGGALALSQAASLRIALDDAVFHAPEPGLGLLPAGGGLVRLARRAGPEAALALLGAPEGVPALAAMQAGICDVVLSAETAEPAVLVRALQEDALPPGRASDAGVQDPAKGLTAIAAARAEISAGPLAEAARRAADCLEASLMLPFEEALDFADIAYEDLVTSQVSQGLRHAAHARRHATWLAGVPAGVDADLAQPLRLALWNQPETFALALIGASHSVTFGASDPARLQTAFSRIAHVQETEVHAGTLEPAQRDADWARLGAATDLAGLRGPGLGPSVVFAAFHGQPEVRAAELAQLRVAIESHGGEPPLMVLDGVVPERGEIGQRRVPEGAMVELFAQDDVTPEHLARVHGLLDLEADAVIRGGASGPGIVARLEAALFCAAERAVMAGARPADVDQAVRALGFSDGPLLHADKLGLARTADGLSRAGRAPGPITLFLIEEGQGIYRTEGGQTRPAPGLDATLEALRTEAGLVPRTLGRTQIQARVLAELAAEGAAMLQHGLAHRASDVDVAAVLGLGFPPALGGPMFQADQMGLLATRTLLRALQDEGAPAPVTLWDVLIRNGRRFGDLDA